MRQVVIALDIGTSSTKAVVFGTDGERSCRESHEYHTVFPRPSWVEQDPDDWIGAAYDTLARVGGVIKSRGLAPLAIAVTSQRASLIPIGADDRPLRRAIMWQDKRTIEVCRRLTSSHGMHALHRLTGLRVDPLFVLNKLIWLREHEPETFAAARRFIGVQDLVVRALTGEYATDVTQASRTMLMDLARSRWDDSLLEVAGIDESRLCRIVRPGEIVGGVSRDVAERCGLPPGLPVAVCGGDQQNAAIALGVVRPGAAEANTGTGSFVLSYAERPTFDDECRVLTQASAIAGRYVVETSIFNTGSIFRWLKERAYSELASRDDAYARMDDEAARSPVGSGGVVMLPHFEGSAAPHWDPQAKGVFFNLGLGTTRADITRCVLEGIALEIAEDIRLMRGMIGEIASISTAGGMAASDLFCGIQADACRASVVRADAADASALGACMNALVSLGVYATHEEAYEAMRGSTTIFEPRGDRSAIYDRIAARREKLYRALADGGVYDAFMGEV